MATTNIDNQLPRETTTKVNDNPPPVWISLRDARAWVAFKISPSAQIGEEKWRVLWKAAALDGPAIELAETAITSRLKAFILRAHESGSELVVLPDAWDAYHRIDWEHSALTDFPDNPQAWMARGPNTKETIKNIMIQWRVLLEHFPADGSKPEVAFTGIKSTEGMPMLLSPSLSQPTICTTAGIDDTKDVPASTADKDEWVRAKVQPLIDDGMKTDEAFKKIAKDYLEQLTDAGTTSTADAVKGMLLSCEARSEL